MSEAQSIAAGFSRVCYVTADIDSARVQWRRLIGIDRFAARTISVTAREPDRAASEVALKIASARLGPRGRSELQLIEPLSGDSIFSRRLKQAGPGVHHIGFTTAEFDGAAAAVAAHGMPAMELRAGAARAAFFHCAALGATVEIAERDADWTQSPEESADAFGAQDRLASYFMQVAYMTRDLEEAHRWLRGALGLRDFATHEMAQGPALNLKVRGRAMDHDFRLKRSVGNLGPDGGVEIELLEPERGDNPMDEFLRSHGPGLHHIAFKVPDYDAVTGALRATGVPPLKEISRGRLRSSYFDCTREGLSYIEVFQVD